MHLYIILTLLFYVYIRQTIIIPLVD